MSDTSINSFDSTEARRLQRVINGMVRQRTGRDGQGGRQRGRGRAALRTPQTVPLRDHFFRRERCFRLAVRAKES